MSIRVEPFVFRCKGCSADLVFLHTEMTCPKCGRQIPNLPQDEAPFAENAICTMLDYKEDHGFYRPLGLAITSMGYHLLSIAYTFFDYLEQKNPENKEEFLKEFITDIKIEDEAKDGYLRKHYHGALSEILKIYIDPGFKKYAEDTRETRRNRVKSPKLEQAVMEKVTKQKWWEKLRAKYLS